MASDIDSLPTISSCQDVSQMNLATARWGPHTGYRSSIDRQSLPCTKPDPPAALVCKGNAVVAHPVYSVTNVRSYRRESSMVLDKSFERLGVAVTCNHGHFWWHRILLAESRILEISRLRTRSSRIHPDLVRQHLGHRCVWIVAIVTPDCRCCSHSRV
jgi:hypothetical protein